MTQVEDADLEIAKSIVAGLPDAAILLTRDLETIEFNTAYAVMSGVSRRRLGRALDDGPGAAFSVIGSGTQTELVREALASGKVVRRDEVPVRNANDEEFIVIESAIPVVRDEQTLAVIHCLRDVNAES
ncbi:MAG: hypothetical protein AAF658_08185, partial [Myxococcota bacterium]